MNLRMLEDKVLFERIKSEEVTPGGIIIPDRAKERSVFAIVRAVGPGKYSYGNFIRTSVRVGMKVVLAKWVEEKVKDEDGKEYNVGVEADVLAIVEEGLDSIDEAEMQVAAAVASISSDMSDADKEELRARVSRDPDGLIWR